MALLTTPPVKTDFFAPDFKLLGIDGKYYALSDIRGEKATVIMFICNHCPYVRSIADLIVRDVKELEIYGVKAAAIMSNDVEAYPEDSYENMKIFAAKHNFTFPYLWDDTQKTAIAYDAVCTPEFYGFDAQDRLLYRGRLDASRKEIVPNAKRDLFDAMVQIATFGQAPENQFSSMGCSLKWK